MKVKLSDDDYWQVILPHRKIYITTLYFQVMSLVMSL